MNHNPGGEVLGLALFIFLGELLSIPRQSYIRVQQPGQGADASCDSFPMWKRALVNGLLDSRAEISKSAC